jgi:hypothetical protein
LPSLVRDDVPATIDATLPSLVRDDVPATINATLPSLVRDDVSATINATLPNYLMTDDSDPEGLMDGIGVVDHFPYDDDGDNEDERSQFTPIPIELKQNLECSPMPDLSYESHLINVRVNDSQITLHAHPDQTIAEVMLSLTDNPSAMTLVNSDDEYIDHNTLASDLDSSKEYFLQRISGFWRNEQRKILRPEVISDESATKAQALIESTNMILQGNVDPNAPDSNPDENLPLYLALQSMLGKKDKAAFFFDSRNQDQFSQTLIDQGHQLNRLGDEDVNIVSFHFEGSIPINRTETYCLSGDPAVKEEFATYFSELLKLPREKCLDMEIRAGSVIVDLNAAGWSLGERNAFVQTVTSTTTPLPEATEVTIHPLFKSCIIDIAIFDKRGNKSDFGGHQWSIGPQGNKRTYYQPPGGHGWVRYGLDVLGKYPDGDEWLHRFGDDGNWWRAYHGTDKTGMEGIGKGGVIYDSTGGKLGKGVYTTPHIEYAASYAQAYEANDRKFIFIFQCAVKPGEIQQVGFAGTGTFTSYPGLEKIFGKRYGDTESEWTVPSNHVRPYGIIIGEVEKLEEIYGKGAVGHRKIIPQQSSRASSKPTTRQSTPTTPHTESFPAQSPRASESNQSIPQTGRFPSGKSRAAATSTSSQQPTRQTENNTNCVARPATPQTGRIPDQSRRMHQQTTKQTVPTTTLAQSFVQSSSASPMNTFPPNPTNCCIIC